MGSWMGKPRHWEAASELQGLVEYYPVSGSIAVWPKLTHLAISYCRLLVLLAAPFVPLPDCKPLHPNQCPKYMSPVRQLWSSHGRMMKMAHRLLGHRYVSFISHFFCRNDTKILCTLYLKHNNTQGVTPRAYLRTCQACLLQPPLSSLPSIERPRHHTKSPKNCRNTQESHCAFPVCAALVSQLHYVLRTWNGT